MKALFVLPCLLQLLTTAPVANGYPNGPPLSACTSMYPSGHKVDAQISDPPYELVISNNYVSLGQNVAVTLRQKTGLATVYDHFRGVFIQARMANCESDLPIGTFVLAPDDTKFKTLDCHKHRPMSALVHKNNTKKYTETFTWTAPTSESGRIYFRATVVYNSTTFWTNVFSSYLEDTTDDSEVPKAYCQVQSTVGSASSLAAVTSLVVAAVVTSLMQFF